MAATVKVWDPVVRIFHWSLVTCFAVAWFTGDEWAKPHEITGYIIATLIMIRLIWGFAGSYYARFSQFFRKPQAVFSYLRDIIVGNENRYIGHNPAGAAMIIVLLLMISATAFTGWLYTTDRFWGVEWVEDTHKLLANALIAMIALHLCGVFLASRRHAENLILAMITGRKRKPEPDDIQ